MGLLSELPEAQRGLLAAHVLDGRPYRELAMEQRLAEATIRKRVSRGLARLPDRLREEEEAR